MEGTHMDTIYLMSDILNEDIPHRERLIEHLVTFYDMLTEQEHEV